MLHTPTTRAALVAALETAERVAAVDPSPASRNRAALLRAALWDVDARALRRASRSLPPTVTAYRYARGAGWVLAGGVVVTLAAASWFALGALAGALLALLA